ncbi:hypothetical protein HYQ46_013311 [Verticillium longisporum]|nr:hypothetical protein HYQ46_013311 [Verticillium longisporum]
MHHAPLAVGAGVPKAAMDWLKGQAGDLAEPSVAAEGTDLFGEGQWAALLLADEMTRDVQVSDETFAKVKGLFGEREVVELVATVACYNCVSRFLVALDGSFLDDHMRQKHRTKEKHKQP